MYVLTVAGTFSVRGDNRGFLSLIATPPVARTLAH